MDPSTGYVHCNTGGVEGGGAVEGGLGTVNLPVVIRCCAKADQFGRLELLGVLPDGPVVQLKRPSVVRLGISYGEPPPSSLSARFSKKKRTRFICH